LITFNFTLFFQNHFQVTNLQLASAFIVKQVFSEMDFLGWYTTGDNPDDSDIKVHKQICEINESPVLLKVNPQARHTDVSYFHIINYC
jgi:hypothetical protein